MSITPIFLIFVAAYLWLEMLKIFPMTDF